MQRDDSLRWGSRLDPFNSSKTHYAWYDYYFFANGRFQYYCTENGLMHKIEGKYSISNGKIYFKERKWHCQIELVLNSVFYEKNL